MTNREPWRVSFEALASPEQITIIQEMLSPLAIGGTLQVAKVEAFAAIQETGSEQLDTRFNKDYCREFIQPGMAKLRWVVTLQDAKCFGRREFAPGASNSKVTLPTLAWNRLEEYVERLPLDDEMRQLAIFDTSDKSWRARPTLLAIPVEYFPAFVEYMNTNIEQGNAVVDGYGIHSRRFLREFSAALMRRPQPQDKEAVDSSTSGKGRRPQGRPATQTLPSL